MPKKIAIESRGISPLHYYLENVSWNGKWPERELAGLEDIMMAEFLDEILNDKHKIISTILQSAKFRNDIFIREDVELVGNDGNYYYPDEEQKIFTMQPDGWIADGETLILLEAKGYEKNAKLNPGQLAKEFIITKNIAENCGYKDFFVMLIAPENNHHYLSVLHSPQEHLKNSFSELKNLLQENINYFTWADWEKEIFSHFIMISWEDIFNIPDIPDSIRKIIKYHKTPCSEETPFCKFVRTDLKMQNIPLSEFYNGGCGNEQMMKYESGKYTQWHALNNIELEELRKLDKLRTATQNPVEVRKMLVKFYQKYFIDIPSNISIRKAFEILGNSSQIPDYNRKYFKQRYYVTRDPTSGKIKCP